VRRRPGRIAHQRLSQAGPGVPGRPRRPAAGGRDFERSTLNSRESALPFHRPFATTARLAFVTAGLMFALIAVGGAVRVTGSGLACPDWPLCEGRLIPRFEFHVLIEWFHRLIALCVGILLLATAVRVWTDRETRSRLGVLAGAAVGLYVAQALLGALTVWKLLSPAMVSSHLAVGALLFSTLLVLGLSAAEALAPPAAFAPRSPALQPLAALAVVWTWLQMVLGGMVSSTHAGLACPDWPTCYGRWIVPMQGAIGLQMMHRASGYGLFVVMLLTALVARRAPDARVAAAAAVALGLTVLQMVIGVGNVLLGTPVWLSVLHLATAAAILAHAVMTLFRASRLPAGPPALAVAEAR
jgi:heme A synthase